MPRFESTSLVEVLKELKKKGYHHAITIAHGQARIPDTGDTFLPENLSIAEVIRLEGDSNADEEAIVYAVLSTSGVKGVIIDSFGPHADQEIADFIDKIV
jgi:hypothetical protein